MTLEEFKNCIEHQIVLPKVLVCKCEDETSDFVFHQYLRKYVSNNNLTVSYVDELIPVTQSTLFDIQTNSVFVYITNELKINQIPTQQTWIKCKKISSSTQELLKENIVEIPKLEDWHIKDYVYSQCSELSENELQQILKIYGKNLFRLENELSKILIFEDKNKVYSQIKNQLFIENSEYGIFDFINAIVKYDKATLTTLLLNIDNIDVDVFGCLKLLLNNFYKVINVQLSKAPNAKDLGMTDKQLWAIKKYSCGIYTKNQLLEIYKFLTKCDFYIKSGYVPVPSMLDYIIVNIMSIKERVS